MISIDVEIALVGLAAMLEPATLASSLLALVVGDRPVRAGSWFYLGGLGVTLVVGVLAALVLGNTAASDTSTPKTWVSIISIVAGATFVGYAVRLVRRPTDPAEMTRLAERMHKVAAAPAPAIMAAGAALANPGIFMVVAAKSISQLNPSTAQYLLDWTLFAVVALLPLGAALLMLLVAREFTTPLLIVARGFIERHSHTIIAVVLLGLGASLLRDGIAGITG